MIESLGLALLFVPALTTFIWFVFNVYLHLPLNQLTLAVSFLIGFVLVLPLLLPFRFSRFRLGLSSLLASPWSFLPLCLILAVVALVTLLNWYYPPYYFDTLTMYDFRGRVFFLQHNIEDIANSYHGGYPLYTSLAHTALYFLGFANPKWFYSYLLLSYALVFSSWLSRRLPIFLSLAGLLLLLTTPQVFFQSTIAYTNLAYLAYLSLSALYLSDYWRRPRFRYLLVASVSIALAAWTRPATHPYFAVFILLLAVKVVSHKKFLHLLLPLVCYLAISLPWSYFQSHILQISALESQYLSSLPSGLPLIASGLREPFLVLGRNLLSIKYAGTTGWLFVVTLCLGLIKRIKLSRSLLIITTVYLLSWLALSFLIRLEYTDYRVWVAILYDSMSRMFIVFFPLLIALSLIHLHRIIKL